MHCQEHLKNYVHLTIWTTRTKTVYVLWSNFHVCDVKKKPRLCEWPYPPATVWMIIQKFNVNFIINYKNYFHIWTEYIKYIYYDASIHISHATVYWCKGGGVPKFYWPRYQHCAASMGPKMPFISPWNEDSTHKSHPIKTFLT